MFLLTDFRLGEKWKKDPSKVINPAFKSAQCSTDEDGEERTRLHFQTDEI